MPNFFNLAFCGSDWHKHSWFGIYFKFGIKFELVFLLPPQGEENTIYLFTDLHDV